MGLHLQQEERDPHQVKIATMLSQILVPAGSGSFHSRRKSAILSQNVKNEDIYFDVIVWAGFSTFNNYIVI